MEGLRSESRFCRHLASKLKDDHFTLIDVGCSGGIDNVWREFGDRLHAFAFDPNVEECNRLTRSESLPNVQYVAAFVGMPPDAPVAVRRGVSPYTHRSPWNRLSVARSVAIRAKLRPDRGNKELTSENQWSQTVLADPSKPIFLPDFFRLHAIDDIDLLKMDVDGPDFDILQTLTDSLQRLGVLAVGLEVNFYGSDAETDHTFHNTDRFMRRLGFDLFHLTVRPYSLAALPARYQISIPAQTVFGRPLQGDALYVRDLGDPERADGRETHPLKLAKLAGIFAAFGLYDCAAEVIVTHAQRLRLLLDLEEMLNLLAEEAQGATESKLSYRELMAAFEHDDARFYP